MASTSSPAEEKRVDPEDGTAYTFAEMSAYYAGKYKKPALNAYWEECKPVKGKARGKAKAKAKAKVAQEPKEPREPLRKPADPDEMVKRIAACKVIPVIKIDDVAHAVPLCTALKEGGIDVAEITFRTECAVEAMREVSNHVAGCCVGAGTVMTAKQVDLAIDAGADFIVSPGFDAAVWKRCKQRGALYLPGVVTPTEVMLATSRYKLTTLKFFPAGNYGGAGTLKSFSAVFGGTTFMPTGGVTEANIGDYVSLPNVIAAGGSWMVADADVKKAAESGDWSAIKEGAKKASEAALAGAKK